jgi:hypothetical protein
MASSNNNNNNNNSGGDDRKRPAQSPVPTTPSPRKKPSTPSSFSAKKPLWGLRQFSWRICKIVQERGVTTYAQVADELCNDDFGGAAVLTGAGGSVPPDHSDLVNVRRRVYDALNVLTGLDIIQKNVTTRTIQWMGMDQDNNTTIRPAHLHQLPAATAATLPELQHQVFCYRNVILLQHERHHGRLSSTDGGTTEPPLQEPQEQQQQRDVADLTTTTTIGAGAAVATNAGLAADIATTGAARRVVAPTGYATSAMTAVRKVPLPCLLVRTSNECLVRCEMSPDRSIVHFDFSMPFQISDDTTILQELGLYVCTCM